MVKDKVRVGPSLRRGQNPTSSMLDYLFSEIAKKIMKKISWKMAKEQVEEMKIELEKIRKGEGV